MGRRLSKTVNGTQTGYLYDGLNPVQELSGATPKATLITGGLDEFFSRTSNGTTSSFLTDALGSTLALTDSAGNLTTQYSYEAYGKTTQSGTASDNPFQYTGRENDGTGLYYYRARYYDPELSRFISEDPLGFGGGDVNLAAYVGGNPLSYTDPLGLYSWDEFVGDAANASAGFGDSITWGATDWVRDWMGTNGGVDKCSSAYSGGEWAGIGYGFAAGGAAGWRAAGEKAAGKEFSHWVPNRAGGPRSKWNGNYVTPQQHYYHDPYRYPKGWRDLGPKWSKPAQQFDRIPNVYKGAAAGGAAAGGGAAANSCKCR